MNPILPLDFHQNTEKGLTDNEIDESVQAFNIKDHMVDVFPPTVEVRQT